MPAETKVNTYALMEACRFGVVFSVHTGLRDVEFWSMLGRPVLVGTHTYYTRRGFTVDARDRDHYFVQLARMCDEAEPALAPSPRGRRDCSTSSCTA